MQNSVNPKLRFKKNRPESDTLAATRETATAKSLTKVTSMTTMQAQR